MNDESNLELVLADADVLVSRPSSSRKENGRRFYSCHSRYDCNHVSCKFVLRKRDVMVVGRNIGISGIRITNYINQIYSNSTSRSPMTLMINSQGYSTKSRSA